MANTSRIVFKYGVEEMRDVVLDVGGADFHVNKAVLSAQSRFFYVLFNSAFKEGNENKFNIEADVSAFGYLMGMIFNLNFKMPVACPPSQKGASFTFAEPSPKFSFRGSNDRVATGDDGRNDKWAKDLWNKTMSTLELAERFQMDNVKKMISDRLKESNCGKENCVNCALKLFLRCVYKMIEPSETTKITKFAFAKLFEWYSDVMGDLLINVKDMKNFVKMANIE